MLVMPEEYREAFTLMCIRNKWRDETLSDEDWLEDGFVIQDLRQFKEWIKLVINETHNFGSPDSI
jgi:hypothetical protein